MGYSATKPQFNLADFLNQKPVPRDGSFKKRGYFKAPPPLRKPADLASDDSERVANEGNASATGEEAQ